MWAHIAINYEEVHTTLSRMPVMSLGGMTASGIIWTVDEAMMELGPIAEGADPTGFIFGRGEGIISHEEP